MDKQAGNGYHPIYGYMGFVKGALSLQSDAEVLYKEFARLNKKALTTAKAALSDAIWSGHWECKQQAEDRFKEALNRGQFLLCWQGTTALKVSA